MMARQHVTFAVGLSGVAMGAAAFAFEPVEHWVRERPASAALLLLLVAGGALVPDIDHHQSTLVVKLGWIGSLMNLLLRLLGIRHRGFMHSLLFAVLNGVAFYGLEALVYVNQWVAIALGLMFLLFASVTLGFVFGRVGRNPLVVVGLGVALVYGYTHQLISLEGHWLAIGAFGGPVLHDVGDMLTHGKLPFLYPFTKARMGAPLTFRTGGFLETIPLRLIFGVWALLAVTWVGLMGFGHLERTNLSELRDTDGSEWTHTLPYVLWVLEPSSSALIADHS